MTSGLLQGWQVLIGSSSQTTNSELIGLLDGVGATAQAVALIQIGVPGDTAGLDNALLALSAGDYQWVAFTSANTVRALVSRADELVIDPLISAETRVAAVGPATVAALKAAGFPVDLVPEQRHQSAAGLVTIWPAPHSQPESVLLPGSQIAMDTLDYALSAMGYEVDRVIAYRTENLRPPKSVVDDLIAGRFQAVLLNSPSAAASLAAATTVPVGTVVGCIGHTTAKAAFAQGFTVGFVAASPTPAALVAGLIAFSAARSSPSQK